MELISIPFLFIVTPRHLGIDQVTAVPNLRHSYYAIDQSLRQRMLNVHNVLTALKR